MKNVATCSRSCASFRRRFALLPSWQGSPAFTCTHAPAAVTAKPMSASSFQRSYVLRTDVHLFHGTFLREEQAGNLAHAQLPVIEPHDIAHRTRTHERRRRRGTPHQRTTRRPTANLYEKPGAVDSSSPPKDIGGRVRPLSRRAVRVLEGGGHTHLYLNRVGTGGLS